MKPQMQCVGREKKTFFTLISDFSLFISYLLVKGIIHPQSKTKLEASRFNWSLKSVSSTSLPMPQIYAISITAF